MEQSIREIADWFGGPAGSLWAIRLAMACLAFGYAFQFHSGVRNIRAISVLWIFGAMLAGFHTVTAISAFHSGSFEEAWVSTASRTEAMFGVRVGWGLYVNYVFVAIWWLDAAWRWQIRTESLRSVELGIDFFLIGMAIFGSVVFATGPIRYVGLLVMAIWVALWFRRNSTKRNASEHG
jgi:hypothetical protein